jgi:hypothetical protein
MNWLVKNLSAPLSTLFLALTALIFLSCETSTEIGKDEFDINRAGLETFVEDIAVDPQMFFLDTVSTMNRAQYLVGRAVDRNFGQISCATYAQMSPPNYADTITGFERGDTYVSARLVLIPDGYFYGQLSGADEITVHELSVPIESGLFPESADQGIFPVVENPQFYSFHESLFDPNPIGTGVVPDPLDSIIINISDQYGSKIFNLMLDNINTIFSDQRTFNSFVNGLALRAGTNNQAVVGISALPQTSYLEIIVDPQSAEDDRIFRFYLDNNRDFDVSAIATGYYNIQVEEGISPHSMLRNSEALVSPFDGRIYYQPYTGIMMRVNLQQFIDWRQTQGDILISDVRLQIGPLIDTVAGFAPPFSLAYFNDSISSFRLDEVRWENFSIRRLTGDGDPVESVYFDASNSYDESIYFYVNQLESRLVDTTSFIVVPTFINEFQNSATVIDGLNGFVVNEGDVRLRVIYSTFN